MHGTLLSPDGCMRVEPGYEPAYVDQLLSSAVHCRIVSRGTQKGNEVKVSKSALCKNSQTAVSEGNDRRLIATTRIRNP